jgi:hypothetical protein
MSGLNDLKAEIRALANPEKARVHQKFFQTHKGGYAEGDQFLGLTVPVQRKLAKKYLDLPSDDLRRLLASGIHEDRFMALEILVFQYERGDAVEQRRIFDFYL